MNATYANIAHRSNIVLCGADVVIYHIPYWVSGAPPDHDLWIEAKYFNPDLVLKYLRRPPKAIKNAVGRLSDGHTSVPIFSLQALVFLGEFWETSGLSWEARTLLSESEKYRFPRPKGMDMSMFVTKKDVS